MLKKTNIPLASIIIGTIFVFWPVTEGGFMNLLDDPAQITENKNVTNLSFESIKNYFTSYVILSYQPLASLSYGIEYYFFGPNAFIFHFTNLILHLINTFLVYLILYKIFKNRKRVALLVTLFFAIHPLQTETIGWLSTRSTLLFSLFLLASTYQYIKYLESETKKLKPLILAVLFALLSMFSKSMAILIPFVLIGIDYLHLRKFNWKAVLDKVVFFAMSIVFGIVSLYSRKAIGGASEMELIAEKNLIPYTFYEKICISSYSILFYIKKFLFPYDLYNMYGYPIKVGDKLPFEYLISPYIIIGLLVMAVIICKKSSKEFVRYFLFGIFFFLLSIGLTLNLINFLSQMTAERYMYLGLIGLSIPIVLFLEKFINNPKHEVKAIVFYSIIFVFFAFKSRTQTRIWKDEESYLKNVLAAYERNDIVNNSAGLPIYALGIKYFKENKPKEAIKCFNRTIKMDKFSPSVYAARGASYNAIGKKKLAINDFDKVINTPKLRARKGALSTAFRFKGEVYISLGLYEKSKVLFDSAVYFNPNDNIAIKRVAEIKELLKTQLN